MTNYLEIENDEDFEDYEEDYESPFTNCYVYELAVKETGEIFYVGYDSDDPDSDFRMDGFARKIMETVDTEKTILRTGLREAAAEALVCREINRIEKESNFMLCNYKTTRYFVGDKHMINKAPMHTVSAVERHYLGLEPVPFDKVDISNLAVVYIDEGYTVKEIIEGIYGGSYQSRYSELKDKLRTIGTTIRKSKYAKSVTAWIFVGGSTRVYYQHCQETAKQKLGHEIPIYHLLDVLDALKNIQVLQTEITQEAIEINPINNRCDWKDVNNLGDERAGYDAGYPLWEQGEKLRKEGKITEAIVLFDEARQNGYYAPVLFDSYKKAYRKLKDLENEYDILREEYERVIYLHGDATVLHPFYAKREEEMEEVKTKILKKRGLLQ